MFERVHDVLRNRRMKVEEIVKTGHGIKACSLPEQKYEREKISNNDLKFFNINPLDFLCRPVTIDET